MGSFTKSNCLLLIVGTALITRSVYAEGSASGCDGCAEGEYCEPECECIGENLAQTVEGFCQKVCDTSYYWCGAGTECEKDGNNDYRCVCATGSYEDTEGTCQTGLFFGGIIFYTTSTARLIRSTDTAPSNESVINLLNEIFKDSTGYVGATVISIPTGTNATYELTYQNIDGVDENFVTSSFENATRSCNRTVSSDSLDLNCADTRDTVVVEDALCNEGRRFDGYCESGSTCKSSSKGLYYCNCDVGYASPYAGATFCVAIKCENSEGCSGSFQGECIDPGTSTAYCECSWGFSGDKCDNPWWFVFTVLTGVFGALAIGILVGCLVCSNKRTEKVVKDSEKDDLDLKNPFVDFQPGIVRAKASSNVYNTISDSLTTPSTQGHNNPAYSSAIDDGMEKSGGYAAAGNDYF